MSDKTVVNKHCGELYVNCRVVEKKIFEINKDISRHFRYNFLSFICSLDSPEPINESMIFQNYRNCFNYMITHDNELSDEVKSEIALLISTISKVLEEKLGGTISCSYIDGRYSFDLHQNNECKFKDVTVDMMCTAIGVAMRM